MAENSRHGKSSKELSEEIDRSRWRVSRELLRVREELDLPKKIRRSLKRQPGVWIGGAAVVGLLVAVAFSRRARSGGSERAGSEKPGKTLLEAGFVLGLARIAANLMKPVIVRFVANKVGRYTKSDRFASKS